MEDREKHYKLCKAVISCQSLLDTFSKQSYTEQMDDVKILTLATTVFEAGKTIASTTSSPHIDWFELIYQLPAGYQLIKNEEGWYVVEMIKDFGITYHLRPAMDPQQSAEAALICFLNRGAGK